MDGKSIAHYAVVAVNLDGTYGEIVRHDATLSALAHSDIDPGFFPITFVSKDDIRGAYERDSDNGEVPDNIEKVISELDDCDMRELASDMADDYVNQLYWSSLGILFEENFEERIDDEDDEGDEDNSPKPYDGGHIGDLCAWCCSAMGDDFVKSDATEDAKFCSTSCLYEALMQFADEEVKVIDEVIGDALLECPHCNKQSYTSRDRWSSEGMFEVPGKDGFEFSIMTCPHCGKPAPLTEVH